jgi:peptidoglycan-associated lipoprotein
MILLKSKMEEDTDRRREYTLRHARYFGLIVLMLSLAFTFAACKKKAPEIEPTPSAGAGNVTETPVDTTQPPPPVVTPPEETEITDNVLADITRQLQPVFYDYNKSDIREDQITALQNNGRILKQNARVNVLVEGHCDERGTEEYNLALGERRARASKDYLVGLGIADNRINTISYGESKPFAEGHNEDAWQQNRRAHFVAIKQ